MIIKQITTDTNNCTFWVHLAERKAKMKFLRKKVLLLVTTIVMEEDFKILDGLKKHDSKAGFNVPDDYFDSFEDKMMGIIEAEEKPLGKKIIMVIKPWVSLAAIFVLVALIYYSAPYFLPAHKQISEIITTDTIEEDSSFGLLASSFDESDLIDLIIEEDNATIFEEIKSDPNLLEGLSIEDVEALVIF